MSGREWISPKRLWSVLTNVPLDCKTSTGILPFSVNHVRMRAIRIVLHESLNASDTVECKRRSARVCLRSTAHSARKPTIRSHTPLSLGPSSLCIAHSS